MLVESIPDIIDQHAEEAAFLWLLRDNAVSAPHYDLEDLAELDERVEAHIDGLRIAGDYGWEISKDNLDFKENGELFVATVLALESQETEKLKVVYKVLEENQELQSGFVSALGWVDPKFLQGIVSGFLASKEAFWRKNGIAACAVQRVDPKEALKLGINDSDTELCCQSLKAAGELGRSDLMSEFHKQMLSKDADIQFWAAWAAVLCGDRSQALSVLHSVIQQDSTYSFKALSVLIRCTESDDAKQLLALLQKQSADDPLKQRLLIQGIGMRGESTYILWLIEQMEIPEVAQIAGEAFTLITGVDLAYDDLEKDQPDGFEAGPSEDPDDDNVDLDADEDLPWPNPELVKQWWSVHQAEFNSGSRYLMGQPVSQESCQKVLKDGMQRQRQAAALELALMDDTAVLFETSATGKKQQAQLK